MRLGRVVVAAAAIAMVGLGAAWARDGLLTAEEARQELFGVELTGRREGDGARWTECVEPGGRTAYRFEASRDEGRLEISDEGLACFRYASANYEVASCFAVIRKGETYRFEGGGPAFIAEHVTRGVRSCAGSGVGV